MRRNLAALCRWWASFVEPSPCGMLFSEETCSTLYYGDTNVVTSVWLGPMPPPFALSRLPQGDPQSHAAVMPPIADGSTACYRGNGEGI